MILILILTLMLIPIVIVFVFVTVPICDWYDGYDVNVDHANGDYYVVIIVAPCVACSATAAPENGKPAWHAACMLSFESLCSEVLMLAEERSQRVGSSTQCSRALYNIHGRIAMGTPGWV